MSRTQPLNTLGIDFGTSNSAAGILVNGKPRLIEMEPGRSILPTSVFFDFDARRTLFGSSANAALVDGIDGRFMRSLKSVLGTSLMHEKRRIMGEQLTFVELIARFLAHIKKRAEDTCACPFDYALSGRPVHFHSADPARDAQAHQDLRQCYLAAGFSDVEFMLEPEAAALASNAAADEKALHLIVDIGGGTSDFTVFRKPAESIEILASHGIRVGGTNFDRSISVDHVMPLFGKGSEIGKEMGAGTMPAPNKLFYDLSTWQMIPFLYTSDVLNEVRYLAKLAVDPQGFNRLVAVLEHRLGHDVAFAVEAGKIATNAEASGEAAIDLGIIEKGLAAALDMNGLSRALQPHISAIGDGLKETLALAQIGPERIDSVIYVGGSSLMRDVERLLGGMFPTATTQHADAFTGVVEGLALAAANKRNT